MTQRYYDTCARLTALFAVANGQACGEQGKVLVNNTSGIVTSDYALTNHVASRTCPVILQVNASLNPEILFRNTMYMYCTGHFKGKQEYRFQAVMSPNSPYRHTCRSVMLLGICVSYSQRLQTDTQKIKLRLTKFD